MCAQIASSSPLVLTCTSRSAQRKRYLPVFRAFASTTVRQPLPASFSNANFATASLPQRRCAAGTTTICSSSQDEGMTSQATAADGKTKVLFVCLGNICRSPTAEAVFRAVVQKRGLEGRYDIDSCGTGGGNPDWYEEGGWSYHTGNASDPRMTDHASRRGVQLTSRSRPLTPDDLSKYDYVVGMDAANIKAIRTAAEYWKAKHSVPASYADKLRLMSDFLEDPRFKSYDSVPDPYYGGSKGFELVLDLLDDACKGLLTKIEAKQA